MPSCEIIPDFTVAMSSNTDDDSNDIIGMTDNNNDDVNDTCITNHAIEAATTALETIIVSTTTTTTSPLADVITTTAITPTTTAASSTTITKNSNNKDTLLVTDQDFMDHIIQSYLPQNNHDPNKPGKVTIPQSHIRIGLTNLLHLFQKDIRTVLYHQQVPIYGWSDYDIQYFLQTLSSLDTNGKVPITQHPPRPSTSSSSTQQQQRWVGVGEREGKIYNSLVVQRHYGFSHGMGRSGNLHDPQPKAVGSTILAHLTNQLVYDIITRGGSQIQVHHRQQQQQHHHHQQTSSNQQQPSRNKNMKGNTKQPRTHSIILPTCTGMSIALVLQSLRHKHLQHQRRLQQLPPPTTVLPNKDIVLWSRIDQKSCYKAIVAAGLQCIVIPTKIDHDAVVTDIDAIRHAIQTYTPSRILAIITTTSCFAPRVPDQVDVVAKMILQYNQMSMVDPTDTNQPNAEHMYHVVNHAYGLQCSMTGKLITRAVTIGQVDAIVCSLDKNFLVPVSGSVVLSPYPLTIQQIGKFYAGRASASHIVDICITLLSMGLNGYQQLHQQRQNILLPQFKTQFQTIATKYNERILMCPTNTISFAMTLDHLVRPRRIGTTITTADNNSRNGDTSPTIAIDTMETEEEYLKSIERDLTQLGAMLFHRCISGTRVVARNIQQTLGDTDVFTGFGSSTNHYPHAYITAACAMGLNEYEMNEFFTRFDKTIQEFQKKQRKKE